MNDTALHVCRLTVVGPDRRMDTSVPSDVVLADMVPSLVTQLGGDLPDRGLDHGGWVLQRLGDAPLDEDLTAEESGLRHGDVLYLRPRSDLIPPIDFDDLVDGVATGMRDRAARWRPDFTRHATAAAVGATLVASLVVLALPGDPLAGLVAAWIGVLLLLVQPLAAGRRQGHRVLAGVSAAGAVAHAGLAVLLAGRAATALGADPASWAAVAVLPLAVTVVVAAVALAGVGRTVLTAVAGAIGTAALLALLAAGTGGDLAAAGAIVLCLEAVLRTMVPKAAFRLSGLRLDPLPTSADDLQQDIDPVPGAQVLRTTAEADRLMSVLYGLLGTAGAASVAALLVRGGGPEAALAGCACLGQVLGVRPLTSAWHRLAIGVPASAGGLAALVGVATLVPARQALALQFLLLLLAGLVAGLGTTLARRPVSPVTGRFGDVVQILAGAALLPLALWVMGTYEVARDWLA